MARIETDPNYNSPTFSRATAPTDIFKKEDVQNVAAAFSTHTHDGSGKGLAVAFTGVPPGSIPGTALADGAVTSVKIADGTIATVDLANAAVTNAKLASDTDRSNLLTNGGFEVWQRGTGPFTANAVYSVDRWISNLGGADTLSISKDTTHCDVGSTASAACTFALSGGGGLSSLQQMLKAADGNGLVGRTISHSMRVRTSTASAVRVRLVTDGAAPLSVYSSFHSGGGAYETLTASGTVPSDATNVIVAVYFAASCTAYLDNAMLVVGSQYADYAPMHPADDLARCLRYYEVVGVGSSYLHAGWAGAAGEAIGAPNRWQVSKAVVPTVTKVGTWPIVNCAQPSIGSPSQDGMQFYALSTAIGHVQFNSSGTTIYLTSEANA
jgi:hypothetical protein